MHTAPWRLQGRCPRAPCVAGRRAPTRPTRCSGARPLPGGRCAVLCTPMLFLVCRLLLRLCAVRCAGVYANPGVGGYSTGAGTSWHRCLHLERGARRGARARSRRGTPKPGRPPPCNTTSPRPALCTTHVAGPAPVPACCSGAVGKGGDRGMRTPPG
ncbi:MAG: hypothetical protein J3K34DRAFT_292709 [Monoraphidium minutum]|nr:MAG: hypothetical protein J3K34DRAFT_292709 [Monoraphidium minutum]